MAHPVVHRQPSRWRTQRPTPTTPSPGQDHPTQQLHHPMVIMASECPTPCDDDCDAPCHEAHEVKWKRDHEPEECPPAISVWYEMTEENQ
jgi:hypothetical protein